MKRFLCYAALCLALVSGAQGFAGSVFLPGVRWTYAGSPSSWRCSAVHLSVTAAGGPHGGSNPNNHGGGGGGPRNMGDGGGSGSGGLPRNPGAEVSMGVRNKLGARYRNDHPLEAHPSYNVGGGPRGPPNNGPPPSSQQQDQQIEAVEKKIDAVEAKVDAVEAALSGGPAYLGITDVDLLLKQLEILQKEKEQLREEEDKLREEKLLLLNAAAAPDSLKAGKNVTDFAAALTEASVTSNTLELVNGTFFLGNPKLGSKLFIRPCYKRLSKMILNGAWQNIVLTGTPGIGKSVFGLYLLYLLRCQGKTVVFEQKDKWYRFSDDKVAEVGRFDAFFDEKYLTEDPNAWYLSDPMDRPKQMFTGTTVVLVSPKVSRVHDFLKQAESIQYFMPVFIWKELLACRRAVYPHVPMKDVRKAFGIVGGVARAVFSPEKVEPLKEKMGTVAENMDVKLLRQVLSGSSSGRVDEISTDETGDALLHMFDAPGTNFKRFSVNFASDHARNVTAAALPTKEVRALAALVGAALSNEELGEKVTQGAIGIFFERVSHNAIGGGENAEGSDGREFGMEILHDRSDESNVFGNDTLLSFDFERRRQFEGFPDTLASGTYYQPKVSNFKAIDSLGVNKGGDTLYFFQMKSKGVVAVDGAAVEKYWGKVVAKSNDVTRCAFVYVVPAPFEGQKPTKICKAPWLKGATGEFRDKCSVCVIEVTFEK